MCVQVRVSARGHTHQNLKYAPTRLKINRMALVKTVKYKTSTLLFKNALLPEVGLSESSWYEDQHARPLRPHRHVNGNKGWEDTDGSLNLAK